MGRLRFAVDGGGRKFFLKISRIELDGLITVRYSSSMGKQVNTLAEQLKAAIAKYEFSVYRLAKEAGVPQPVLWRFVKGQRDLTLSTASKVAKVLGLAMRPKRKGR